MAGIGVAGLDELFQQFFSHDLFPVPLAALRELTDRLAQSVQDLEARLQQREGTCD